MYVGNMSMKMFIVLLLITMTAALNGCADSSKKTGRFTEEEMEAIPFANDDMPSYSGGLVLSIDTETVTVDEIVEPIINAINADSIMIDRNSSQRAFKLKIGPDIATLIRYKVRDILIYNEAKKNAPENFDEIIEKVIEKEVNQLLAKYDNDYVRAEKALKEQGMDWNKYRELQKKNQLIGLYYSQKSILDDSPITHGEMLDRYEAMQKDDYEFIGPPDGLLQKQDVRINGMVQFRLIDINPNELSAEEIDEDNMETPTAAAIRKARMLIEKINKGEDFGELAQKYSHGIRAQMGGGGLWTPVPEDTPLVKPWTELKSKAEQMKIGEVAGPIESHEHIFIMKLEDKVDPWLAPFEELQERIEIEIKMARIAESNNKMIKKLEDQAGYSNGDFINYCIDAAWRKWKAGLNKG